MHMYTVALSHAPCLEHLCTSQITDHRDHATVARPCIAAAPAAGPGALWGDRAGPAAAARVSGVSRSPRLKKSPYNVV